MTLLAWILAWLGSIGGILILYAWLRAIGIRIAKNRNEKSKLPQYRYNDLTIRARISDSGKKWMVTRDCELVSLVEGLKNIRIGALPFDAISYTFRIEPDDIKIVHEEQSGGYRMPGLHLHFKKPLGKDATIRFKLCFDLVKYQLQKDHLTWSSAASVDELTLRVAFEAPNVKELVGSICNASDEQLYREILHLDFVNYETQFDPPFILPNLVYTISWEYK